MKMKKITWKKLILVMLTWIFSIGLVSAVLKAASYIGEKNAYIEVGGNQIAYVPRTTKYVRYKGEIRKIIKFALTLSPDEVNCECPNCCKGNCYVIVSSDSGPIIILCVIWFSC
jgi:hypothetical protein